MASFTTAVAADTTGTGPRLFGTLVEPSSFGTQDFANTNANLISWLFSDFHARYAGSFTFNPFGGTINFTQSQETATGALLQSWSANDSDTYDALRFFTSFAKDAYEYMFKEDDYLEGSTFADRLAGWAGDDYIASAGGNDELYGGSGKDFLFGEAGNDKLWGGSGKDTFVIEEDGGKDRIKDFKIKKDSIFIDRDIIANQKDLAEIAQQKGDKAVFNFGDGNKLIVDHLDIDHLDQVSFSFLPLNT